MTESVKREIELLRKDVPKLNDLPDESLFSLVCQKYFYNDGHFDFRDYKSTFTDGPGDGGIDFVTAVESDDGNTILVLAQSKYVGKSPEKKEIINIFKEIDSTFRVFAEGGATGKYNDKLRNILRNKVDEMTELSPKYELSLFIDTNLTEQKKEELREIISQDLDAYDIYIRDSSDICAQIDLIKEPKINVKQDKIEIQINDHCCLEYGESGVLVNVLASSLNKLYDKYHKQGLFGQNFRNFVPDRKIDDNIKQSLQKRRDMFWFLNNGIIIGCSDFNVDGNTVKLWDFSIINGCQTTTLIGRHQGKPSDRDFVVPCKVVKPPEGHNFDEFISLIAESSNSQKPISQRDLKANAREQKNLQKELEKANLPIYLEIKRGTKKPSKKNTEPWQFIKNDSLGQLILSFFLQMPGTARSNKKKLFADDAIYRRVYKNERDANTLADLVKLNYYYSEFSKRQIETAFDQDYQTVCIYGYCHTLAMIGFLLKVKRKLLNLKDVSKDKTAWEIALSEDNISGPIFASNRPDNFDIMLQSLLAVLVASITSAYRAKEYTSVPNFMKKDSSYREEMLKYFMEHYYSIPAERAKVDEYMQIFE